MGLYHQRSNERWWYKPMQTHSLPETGRRYANPSRGWCHRPPLDILAHFPGCLHVMSDTRHACQLWEQSLIALGRREETGQEGGTLHPGRNDMMTCFDGNAQHQLARASAVGVERRLFWDWLQFYAGEHRSLYDPRECRRNYEIWELTFRM